MEFEKPQNNQTEQEGGPFEDLIKELAKGDQEEEKRLAKRAEVLSEKYQGDEEKVRAGLKLDKSSGITTNKF